MIIYLYFASPGIIFLQNTGITYTNQTGGYACNHPEAEGIYMPLPHYFYKKLNQHFVNEKWQGWCCNGIDEETADFIDRTLDEINFDWAFDKEKGILKTDRSILDNSEESWIYLKWNDKQAILTWENSD